MEGQMEAQLDVTDRGPMAEQIKRLQYLRVQKQGTKGNTNRGHGVVLKLF